MLSLKARNTLAGVRQKVQDTFWIKGAYHQVSDMGKEMGCFMGLLNCQVGISAHTASGDFRELDLRYATAEEVEAFTIRQEILTLMEQGFEISEDYDGIEGWNDASARTREEVIDAIDWMIGYSPPERPLAVVAIEERPIEERLAALEREVGLD